MKVLDCVTYYDELDHLQARIEMLDGLVDLHVVCEGTHTHQGDPKPLHLDGVDLPDNVVRCVADLGGYTEPWDREEAQRDYIGITLRSFREWGTVDSDDIAIVADVDEHVNPEIVPYLDRSTRSGPVSLSMSLRYYDLGWEDRNLAYGWTHAKALRVRDIPDSLSKLRLTPPDRALAGAGWHCSYMGGPDRRAAKLRAYAHAEQNNPDTHALIATAHETGIGPNGETLTRVTDYEGIPEALVRRFT